MVFFHGSLTHFVQSVPHEREQREQADAQGSFLIDCFLYDFTPMLFASVYSHE